MQKNLLPFRMKNGKMIGAGKIDSERRCDMEVLRKNLEGHMRKFCLELGSKHCGSPELDKAGNYIAEYFESLSIPVIREEFPVRGWTYRNFSLYDVTERREVPAATACFFSNSVDITDVPLWIDWKDIEHLDKLDVRGRLCFVAAWNTNQLGSYVFGNNHLAEMLDEKGAAGAIFISWGHTDLAPSTKIQRSPFLKNLGTAAVAQEGAIYMAAHRNNTFRLYVDADCFDTTAFNVIGRIGSGSRRACVGAHYDTAPLIQGAQDNQGGTAALLEMARLVKDDVPADWCIDFAAFSGEEYIAYDFPMGSGDYVKRHKNEGFEWYINIDDFGGYFHVPKLCVGYPEKLPKIQFPYPVHEAALAGDDKTFYNIGVPVIWLKKDSPFQELHTAMDTLSYTDFDRMCEGTCEYADIFRQLVKE